MCTHSVIPLCSPKQARLPTAIALGSFDGLHAGHRKVINEITNDDTAISTVVSFWPHPREVLYGETRLRLDLPSEKTELLKPLGVKQLVLIPFNKELASLTSDAFVNKVLLKTLHARRIAIGANFQFGKNREGNANTLKALAESHGVEVSIIPIYEDKSGRMSSSRIRSALSTGDLDTAKSLMGRPYCFKGNVVKGRGIGKKIGWPTANLEVDGRKFLPGVGVYSVWVQINNKDDKIPAVMNLGPQPTVDPNSPSALEVHLLNKEIDLQGCELKVEPVKRIRGQKRFNSLEELSSQIGLDAEMARKSLAIN